MSRPLPDVWVNAGKRIAKEVCTWSEVIVLTESELALACTAAARRNDLLVSELTAACRLALNTLHTDRDDYRSETIGALNAGHPMTKFTLPKFSVGGYSADYADGLTSFVIS